MKIGVRKPSLKKSIASRTTGKITRLAKKSVNPLYGKKGMGMINNPQKALYNKAYNKTSVSVTDIAKHSPSSNNSSTQNDSSLNIGNNTHKSYADGVNSANDISDTETSYKASISKTLESIPGKNSEKKQKQSMTIILLIILAVIFIPMFILLGINMYTVIFMLFISGIVFFVMAIT